MSQVAVPQPPANVQEAVRALEMNQAHEEELVLDLEDLDLTSEQISLAGLEKDVDALAQHEVLKSSLDQGEFPGSRQQGGRFRGRWGWGTGHAWGGFTPGRSLHAHATGQPAAAAGEGIIHRAVPPLPPARSGPTGVRQAVR